MFMVELMSCSLATLSITAECWFWTVKHGKAENDNEIFHTNWRSRGVGVTLVHSREINGTRQELSRTEKE